MAAPFHGSSGNYNPYWYLTPSQWPGPATATDARLVGDGDGDDHCPSPSLRSKPSLSHTPLQRLATPDSNTKPKADVTDENEAYVAPKSAPATPKQTRRVNPDNLAARLGPDLVRDLEEFIKPGAFMPSYEERKKLQEKYQIDRRHLYDYLHSRGLRVRQEDKYGNLPYRKKQTKAHKPAKDAAPLTAPPTRSRTASKRRPLNSATSHNSPAFAPMTISAPVQRRSLPPTLVDAPGSPDPDAFAFSSAPFESSSYFLPTGLNFDFDSKVSPPHEQLSPAGSLEYPSENEINSLPESHSFESNASYLSARPSQASSASVDGDPYNTVRELAMQARICDLEAALETERRQLLEARTALQDIRRECREPFVVPMIMDMFLDVSQRTTQQQRSA